MNGTTITQMVSRVRRTGALCVLAVSLVGCSSAVSGKGTSSSTPVGPTPATTNSSIAPATAAALGSTLERIALQAGDLATGYKLQLMPGGDKVAGQVTLDNCGFDFTTEAHRVARASTTSSTRPRPTPV